MQTSGSGSSRASTLSRGGGVGEDSAARRDRVDTAMRDIRSAIERSKHTTLKSPREERDRADEPVWVMR